jgi:hypothetical protein
MVPERKFSSHSPDTRRAGRQPRTWQVRGLCCRGRDDNIRKEVVVVVYLNIPPEAAASKPAFLTLTPSNGFASTTKLRQQQSAIICKRIQI